MTTLAELRLANLREQKKSAEPAAADAAPAQEAAPAPLPAPALPVPGEAEGSEAEQAVRSAAERLRVHL